MRTSAQKGGSKKGVKNSEGLIMLYSQHYSLANNTCLKRVMPMDHTARHPA